jgi:uncharacterized damage-inducible protein DinB
MSLQKLITNYASFNEWANTKIITWLKTYDSHILYQETASSFNTIDYTLQHLLNAEKYWLCFITNANTDNLSWNFRENIGHQIMAELQATSAAIKNTCSNFSAEDLEETLHLVRPWGSNQLNRYEYIMHLINHATFHRGQIITMARSLGCAENVPSTDYNFFNMGR